MTLADARDLSLIWFILFGVIAAAIPGVAFYFSIKGLRALRKLSKPYFALARDYAQRVARATETGSRVAVKPIVFTAGVSARVSYTAKQVAKVLKV